MQDDVFRYLNFEVAVDRRTVTFYYQIVHAGETHDLHEVLKFPVDLPESLALGAILRSLHLALGLSYYKIFVNPAIAHPYAMTAEEAAFWNDVFSNGLGEFLYVNKLDRARLAQFGEQDGPVFAPDIAWQPEQKALLGIGGGKDSIVAGELLLQANVAVTGFVMATGEQLGQTQAVAEVMGVGLQAVERYLDPNSHSLRDRPDAYHGHIPISLIFGLVGATLAIAQNTAYVAVANESSASIPRAEWQGEAVNHQWSKSFEFETELQKYLQTWVAPQLAYFSAIRPLSSVAIAKIFANYSQFFEVFTSDNTVFRIDPAKRPNGRWSLESPKSLSSYILLGPWLSEADLARTFGRDFLDEPALEQLFYELVGLEGHQPLDCVGTVEELVLSLNLMAQQGKLQGSHLMQLAHTRGVVTDQDWAQRLSSALLPAPEQAIPPKLYAALLPLFNGRQWPLERFRGKDIVFIGAGKGRAMAGIQQFLEQHAEIASFTGVDKREGDNPLGFLQEYDPAKTLFVKNEGVPGPEVPVPYLTQLQLFFELLPLTGATAVGITGTKGKTTTTALTAHILQTAGKDVVLAGNIGISPLQALDFATQSTIFVLELSSYQLSDLRVSPHISACINLYNDHTDWHGSLEAYWEAKHNIMRFAGPDDVFIYNPDFPALRAWAEDAQCQSKPIDPADAFDLSNAKLFGDHNRLNVLVARQIVREFGVTDEIVQKAVDSFAPIEHRMEFVAVKDTRTYINDAIGMTPESTIASIKAVHEKYGPVGVLLLGGQDRNYDFTELMQLVAKLDIPQLILFPNTVDKMKAALPAAYKPVLFESEDMAEAVRYASEHAPENSVVLLSTAAPSYLLWKDFEDKGTQFKAAVQSL